MCRQSASELRNSVRAAMVSTLADECREAAARAEWLEKLNRSAKALNALYALVELDAGYEKPERSEEGWVLRLHYCGPHKTRLDARDDLAKIARALKTSFPPLPDIRAARDPAALPYGLYAAAGKLGRLRVRIELRVPWLPPGWDVVRHERRRWYHERTVLGVHRSGEVCWG